jgi:hypothetical protein
MRTLVESGCRNSPLTLIMVVHSRAYMSAEQLIQYWIMWATYLWNKMTRVRLKPLKPKHDCTLFWTSGRTKKLATSWYHCYYMIIWILLLRYLIFLLKNLIMKRMVMLDFALVFWNEQKAMIAGELILDYKSHKYAARYFKYGIQYSQ